MASPFNVFRKHQKVILVAAGVLCMFVFVIGDVLFQFASPGPSGDGGTGANDSVVEWNGGELSRLELDSLQTRRNIVRNFLLSVQQAGIDRSGGTSPSVRPLGVTRQASYGREAEEIVLRYLMAQKAQDAGMVVSDAAINNYLSQLAQGQVSSDELRGFVSNLQAGGRRVGMNYIFDAIREEMLADAYLDSYAASVQTVTPAQRWEDWRKLNDRIVVESMAVPVGNFVDQVPQPKDEEIQSFYEQYKNREPTPVLIQPFTELPSPDPAFRIPRKVEIHYIEADFQTVAKSIEADITEEEILQYYEQHKDPQFIRPQLDLGVEGDDDGVGAATESIDGLPPEPPDPTQGSHFGPPPARPTQYVAYQLDPPADSTADADALDAASARAVEADDPAAADSENPFTGDDAIQFPPPSTVEGIDAAIDPASMGSFEGRPPEPKEIVELEFLPLEVVRDEIRESIARDRVEAKLLEIMPLINSDLLAVFREYEDRRLDAEEAGKEPDTAAPPELDLQSIAEKYGLEAKQTVPLSYLELRETPVGKSMVRAQSQAYSAYAFSQPLFQPAWTVGIPETLVEQMQGGFTQYIALKVDDTGDRVPELPEIRDEVVRILKRVEARDEAFAKAETLAKEVDESGESLEELFADNQQYVPLESDPFSWYERQFDSRFHLAKPFGVDHAGPDFFETVFSLEPGKAAAVWNHDKSIAYVVQLVRHQQSEDALRNRFLLEGHRADRFPEQSILDLIRGLQLRQALEQSVFAEAGVRWKPVAVDEPADET